MTTPIPVNQQEVDSLFKEKGELITQLEIAQGKLQQVNSKLAQIYGIQQQPIQVK